MKLQFKPRDRAFSQLELAVVLAILALLILVLLRGCSYSHGNARARAMELKCASNLKSLAQAFQTFAAENGGKYPYRAEGAPAYSNSTSAWVHFLSLSNQIPNPRILICPADLDRVLFSALDFGTNSNEMNYGLAYVTNRGVSYFVGLDADPSLPQSWLLGDRNLEVVGRTNVGPLLTLEAKDSVSWTSALHTNRGNVVLGDGSVQMFNSPHSIGGATGMPPQRLLLPLVPSPVSDKR